MAGEGSAGSGVSDVCQRALALGLRRETTAAFELLESTAEALDTARPESDAHLRELAEAVYLMARWTGEFQRAEKSLNWMADQAHSPTTRGWVTVRMTAMAEPVDKREREQSALGDFTIAGDDLGQALSMLSMAFPAQDLLPSVEFRLASVAAAAAVGERAGDQALLARAGNVRAALWGYAGNVEACEAEYAAVWESFHMGSPLLSTEAAHGALNYCLTLLAWGRSREVGGVLERCRHIVTGPRTRDWYNLIRASVLIHRGQFRGALEIIDTIQDARLELEAIANTLRASCELHVRPRVPRTDLEDECATLERHSMQLGALARQTQAELRAARGEPRPHRDLVEGLRRLVPSRPRFGWDGAALTLAQLAPGEAREVLGDMWEFWPAGPGPEVRRSFAEALLEDRVRYEPLVDVADRFEAAEEYAAAGSAMLQAADVAPSGATALLATRRALELYEHTDAERSIAALLRTRRLRRSPGAPTIPASQKHAVNAGLTPREREVVELAAEGLTAREIADRLTLSAGTVRNHLLHAREKLGGLPKREFVRFR